MADLTDLQAAETVKLVGSNSSGLETNPLAIDVSGNAQTIVNNGSGVSAVNVQDGGNSLTVDQNTAANLNAQVVGNVASASSDSGNPVKMGGVFNTTPSTLTNGQRGDIQISSMGSVLVAGQASVGSTPGNNPVSVSGVDGNGLKRAILTDSRGAISVTELYSHGHVTGATTVTIKSGAGYLKRITISRPTNGSATVYDNTTATGTPIITINYSNGTSPTTLEYGFTFTTGLTIVTTGTNTDLSIMYL